MFELLSSKVFFFVRGLCPERTRDIVQGPPREVVRTLYIVMSIRPSIDVASLTCNRCQPRVLHHRHIKYLVVLLKAFKILPFVTRLLVAVCLFLFVHGVRWVPISNNRQRGQLDNFISYRVAGE